MADQILSDLNIPPTIKNNITTIIIAVVAIVVGYSSLYQVDTEEVGIVTRFGEYMRTSQPGLNMKIPFIEGVQKVPVERQLKEEFGFRTVQAGVQTQYNRQGYKDESLMLTGDLNLANVEWVVQYRISDPYEYLFEVRNPRQTLRDLSEAAMRQIVGDRTVNEVITVGRTAIASDVHELIQQLCNEYTTGINIEQIVLQDVNPPDPVREAFNNVNEAQQQKETLINEAKSAYNKVIPRARGQADETIQKARGYAIERVNNSKGEVARFNALYQEYIQAPQITKKRIYLETLTDIVSNLGQKVITDQEGNGVLPLLQMQMRKFQSDTTGLLNTQQ